MDRRSWVVIMVTMLLASQVVSAGPLLDRLRRQRAARGGSEGSTRVALPLREEPAAPELSRSEGIFALSAFPKTLSAFRALQAEWAGTAEGGLFCFLVAAKLYTLDRKLGEEALVLSVGPLNLDRFATGSALLTRGFRDSLKYLEKKPWLIDSCFLGTRQEDHYRLAAPPYRIRITEGPQAAMNAKDRRLMVENSGALPRPFLMTPIEGKWVLQERGSSLFVDVRRAGARKVELPVEIKGGSYFFRSLPKNVAQFKALQKKLAVQPGGGAVMFCLAARLYVEDEGLGLEAFSEALDESLISGGSPIAGFTFHLPRLKAEAWMAELFFRKDGEGRWVARVGRAVPAPPDAMRVPVEMAGQNAPRVFSLRKDEQGLWKIKDAYSNLFRGANRP